MTYWSAPRGAHVERRTEDWNGSHGHQCCFYDNSTTKASCNLKVTLCTFTQPWYCWCVMLEAVGRFESVNVQ